MNDSTLAMIKTLHARLNDLQIVVEKLPNEVEGYDKKLDKIDDQVYLVIVELEKRLKQMEETQDLPKFNVVHGSPESAQNSDAASESLQADENIAATQAQEGSEADSSVTDTAPTEQASTSDASEAGEKRVLKGGIFTEDYELTPKAKETLSGAAKSFGGFLKDAKEVTGEFSEVSKDLKETLDFLPKGKGKKIFRR